MSSRARSIPPHFLGGPLHGTVVSEPQRQGDVLVPVVADWSADDRSGPPLPPTVTYTPLRMVWRLSRDTPVVGVGKMWVDTRLCDSGRKRLLVTLLDRLLIV